MYKISRGSNIFSLTVGLEPILQWVTAATTVGRGGSVLHDDQRAVVQVWCSASA